MAVQILQGDCLTVLPTLPAESVNCVVTSPPYYGLRDYGTATWEGGDPECDHIQRTNKHGGTSNRPGLETQTYEYRETCGKCGATRIDDQIGLEPTPDEYVAKMVQVFREVRRVLRDDGTAWLVIGDSYAGSGKGPEGNLNVGAEFRHLENITKPYSGNGIKPKDLIGIPWRVAFALQADGWWLRRDHIWHKPNPMPEAVKDRCTTSHEYIFLLTKSARYYYDADAIAEESVDPEIYTGRRKRNAPSMAMHDLKNLKNAGSILEDGTLKSGMVYEKRNKRSVWTVTTKPYKEAHFATYPPDLIEPCILAGCPVDGTVLDPFNGAGTTGVVAIKHNRNYIGIELNPEYIELTHRRLQGTEVMLPLELTT